MGLCGFLDRKKQRLSMYQSIGSPKGMQWGKILSHAVMWGDAALAVACLGGFLGYIIEAYVPSDMSNWKDVWSALFSFIASVFGAYTAFVELKTPIRERLGLNFAACVAYCVVLGVVDVVIFLCFVGFILDSEGAAAAWCFVGFVSVLGLLALEVDKARSAYIVSKGDEGKGRYLLINAECLDDDYYYDGSSTDNSGSVSTSVDSNNSKNSGGRLGANCEKLSICAVCTGFVVIVLALLVLMVFVVFTMRYSFAYVKMESIPGRGYKVKGGARLNIYCKGNASAEYPYTVLLEHDTDVPSPSMMPLLHALCQRGMRTCVYDRSGYGWSTRTKNRLPLGTKAAQAVELLEMAGEKPPFVVGAHGRGGFVAVEYVARYNESVAGVVLMDSYLIGQREKEIARIYHNNYKSSVNNVLGKEDALRAFAPFGAAHYSSLNRMKSVDKFLDENFTIKEKPRVTLREAFLWTMESAETVNSIYWDTKEYFDTDIAKYNEESLGEILEGTPLLVVTAAVDPKKKSCSSLGFPEGSKQCQQKRDELEVDWKISKAQAALGASRDLVTCSSKPCTHNFVWENTEWLAEKMEKFIKSIR